MAVSTDSNSPYLLIQRQFETDDGGVCYVETHNDEYVGHFRLLPFDIRPEGISTEIDRANNRRIDITFDLSAALSHILLIESTIC